MEPRELMWLEMMKYYGLSEVSGKLSDVTIMGWFREFGFNWVYDDSETAWCSLAVNVAAKRCGLEYSGKLDARSWMKIGIRVSVPKIGSVVVFWRGIKLSWEGHVGLFAGYNKDKSRIFSLGGNQGNMIQIVSYPVSGTEYGLLGFRELNYISE